MSSSPEIHLINTAESAISLSPGKRLPSKEASVAHLTEQGVEQAKGVNEYLRRQLGAIPNNAFIASSVRSIETAHYALTPSDDTGVDLHFERRFNLPGHLRRFGDLRRASWQILEFADTRKVEAITLAVLHAYGIKAAVGNLLNLSFSDTRALVIPPASDTTLVLKDGEWTVHPDQIGRSTS